MSAETTGTTKPAILFGAGVNMVHRDVVVIGGSAGSLKPLAILIDQLPVGLPASVFVVIHSAADFWSTSDLVEILGRESKLPIGIAMDQQRALHGNVYICPANYHLTLENGLMRLDDAPKEHHTRPSIDVLFRSSALEYGSRVIGVLLSGALQDGVAGLWRIKQRGGVALVQDPEEAEFGSAPKSAIKNVVVDCVQPVHQLATELVRQLIQSTEGTETRTRTVLIVEDEGLVARNLQERLVEAGYVVRGPAKSGEEAVRFAEEHHPDLVLMDIRLEGPMTGVQAARSIWESLQIPIVFVTANADASTLDEVKTVPNYGFVVKPLHSASVQAVIELALDRRAKELQRLSSPLVASR